tara:strand:+ start:863 stop:1120 length:258 start_codon:yes stop_codon:yes gene_type:complete
VFAVGGFGVILSWLYQKTMLSEPVKQTVTPHPDAKTTQVILQQMIEFTCANPGHMLAQAHDAIIKWCELFLSSATALQQLVNRLP